MGARLRAMRLQPSETKRDCRLALGLVVTWLTACGTAAPAKPMVATRPVAAPETAAFAASRERSLSAQMMDTMTLMDRGMAAAPMNGDPNHDFVTMMIPHHQGGIDCVAGFAVGCGLSLAACATTPLGTPASAPVTASTPARATPAATLPLPPAVVPLIVSRAPISSRDRVYAANQSSNTVSVIDPGAAGGGNLLGEISLGAPRFEVLSPIYRGQLNV